MNNLQLFKIAVSAFIVRNDRLLILKRAEDETFLPGVWEVPGGGIDEGESIEEGVVRETIEEASIHVTPQRLFGFFEYTDGYNQKTLNLNFICKMDDASEEVDTSSGEMERAAWVTLAELKDFPFTSSVMRKACEDALRQPLLSKP
jgi:mutator protein MutT